MSISETVRRVLLACSISLLIGGCQSTPNIGSLGRVEVWEVPLQRQAVDTNQQVAEELEGFEGEIQQHRLINVFCVTPDVSAYNGEREWHGLVVLARQGLAHENDFIKIRNEFDGPLRGKVFAFDQPLTDVSPHAFHEYVVKGSKTVVRNLMCNFDADGLPQHVTVLAPVPLFQLVYSKAERARHRQFSDSDFAEGRVGIGHCSLRDTFGEVYFQPSWLFHIPAGTTLTKGDVVEIKLGEAESGAGVGIVSQMTRVLGRRGDFPSDGHSSIFCK